MRERWKEVIGSFESLKIEDENLSWNLPGLGLDIEENRKQSHDKTVKFADDVFGEEVRGETTTLSIPESKNVDQETTSCLVCLQPDLPLAVVLVAAIQGAVEHQVEKERRNCRVDWRNIEKCDIDTEPMTRDMCCSTSARIARWNSFYAVVVGDNWWEVFRNPPESGFDSCFDFCLKFCFEFAFRTFILAIRVATCR